MSAKFPTEGKEYIGWIVEHIVKDGRILYKVRIPALHGKDVLDEHLPFIQSLLAPVLSSATESAGALDVGQLVRIAKDPGTGGSGFGNIIGLFQPLLSGIGELSGSDFNISGAFGTMLEAAKREGIKLPPDLQKVLNENGVEVTKLIEKGVTSLSSLYGLASHGAQSPLNGAIIPQLKQISTAIDSYGSVITSATISKLPGSNFDISQLLTLMPDKLKTELLQSLPDNVKETLNTVLTMKQNYEINNFGGSLSGTKVNLLEFLANAVALLKGIQTSDDLLDKLKTLMSDNSYSGMSSLNQLVENISGTFGDMILKIGTDGSITTEMSTEFQKALASFNSTMSSTIASEGTVFDKVNDLAGMLNRMKPEIAQQVKDVIKLATTNTAFTTAAEFVNGG